MNMDEDQDMHPTQLEMDNDLHDAINMAKRINTKLDDYHSPQQVEKLTSLLDSKEKQIQNLLGTSWFVSLLGRLKPYRRFLIVFLVAFVVMIPYVSDLISSLTKGGEYVVVLVKSLLIGLAVFSVDKYSAV
jgi:hypothetical protein